MGRWRRTCCRSRLQKILLGVVAVITAGSTRTHSFSLQELSLSSFSYQNRSYSKLKGNPKKNGGIRNTEVAVLRYTSRPTAAAAAAAAAVANDLNNNYNNNPRLRPTLYAHVPHPYPLFHSEDLPTPTPLRLPAALFRSIKNYRGTVVRDDDDEVSRQNRRNALFLWIVSAMAGFGEVMALRTYGCFINMCTGNTIRVAVAFVDRQYRMALLPAGILTGYATGVLLGRITKHTIEEQQQQLLQQQQKQQINESSTAAESSNLTTLDPHPVPSRLSRFVQRFIPTFPPSASLTSSVCVAITPMILLLFAAADLLLTIPLGGLVTTTTTSTTIPLWPSATTLAIAYGLLQTAAAEAVGGTLCYVLTVHYTGMARCGIDYLFLLFQNQARMLSTTSSSSIPMTTPTATSTTTTALSNTFWMHAKVIGSFVLGVLGVVIVWDRIVPLLLPNRSSNTLRYFPLHTMAGLVYAGLFRWYGSKKSF